MLKPAPARRIRTPEEEELARKESHLTELEGTLIEREEQLATLQADLAAFEKLYFAEVGHRLVYLERLEQQIGRALAGDVAFPPIPEVATENAISNSTPELKALYRAAARALHPDLAIDEAERTRRTKLMAEANAAYRDGNAARLEELLREARDDPDAIHGTDTAAHLIRCIRRIAQIENRLSALAVALDELTSSDLFSLRSTIQSASGDGRDLLAEMRHSVNERIHLAAERLAAACRSQERK